MKREIIKTQDGSSTIHIQEWNEQYHSKHGAIQEALYVYLKQGLKGFLNSEGFSEKSKNVSVLEIGFGTGLNAFLTLMEAEALQLKLNYVGVEAYPISAEELEQLNYPEALKMEAKFFNALHSCSWEEPHDITSNFQLEKKQIKFAEIKSEDAFDVIYFDAFGPRVQPELWTEAIFKIMYKALKAKGLLVTYCAQGNARRAMISVGFNVEKLDGPPGKRHMLRAVKP